MAISTSTRPLPKALPLYVREVHVNEGGNYWSRTVWCPLTRANQPLRECSACCHCGGYDLDSRQHKGYLMCSYVPEDAVQAVAPPPPETPYELAERTTIADLMATSVLCLADDLTTAQVDALFIERGITGAPVIDHDNKLIGIVSVTELLKFRSKPEATVAQIMGPVQHTLPVDTSVAEAAKLMVLEHIHQAPVIAEGEVVGLITSTDVVRWLADVHGYFVDQNGL